MTCAGCANAIESALKKAEGVKTAQVNFAAEKAYVEYDPGTTNKEKLAKVVRDTGYDVKQEKERITLKIGGMSCAGCAAAVESALAGSDGVLSAHVNIATEKASIEYDPSVVSRETFDRIVAEVGFEVLAVEGEESIASHEDDDVRKCGEARRRMWGTWAFTIPIMLWMIPRCSSVLCGRITL